MHSDPYQARLSAEEECRFRVRILWISLTSSRTHNTELATMRQRTQSASVSAVVEKAFCKNGTYTTAICNSTDSNVAPHSQRFENSPSKALLSSDRDENTVNKEKNTSVVNAIVCAYCSVPAPSMKPPGRLASSTSNV